MQGPVLAFQHNVTDKARWSEVVELFENTSLEVLKQVPAINVDGVFLGIKHSILAMKLGRSARLLFLMITETWRE